MTSGLREEARAWTDPPTSTTVLELPGLVADNLLAFLALLGLMRALEAARPQWCPRTSWSGPPWRARLHFATRVNTDEVASTVREVVCLHGDAYDFCGRRKADFSAQDFVELNSHAHPIIDDQVRRLRLDLIAALGAVGVSRSNKGDLSFYRSPLILADGDSQNYFLERLQKLWKLSRNIQQEFSQYVEDALFRPWQRDEAASEGALRWDHAEARPYAHRARAPNDDRIDPPATELGAAILASLGMTAVSVVPRSRGPATVAMSGYGEGATFTWPVWDVPLGFPAVRTLLRHPTLLEDRPNPLTLKPYGAADIMRATIASVARLKVFGPGEPLWGT